MPPPAGGQGVRQLPVAPCWSQVPAHICEHPARGASRLSNRGDVGHLVCPNYPGTSVTDATMPSILDLCALRLGPSKINRGLRVASISCTTFPRSCFAKSGQNAGDPDLHGRARRLARGRRARAPLRSLRFRARSAGRKPEARRKPPCPVLPPSVDPGPAEPPSRDHFWRILGLPPTRPGSSDARQGGPPDFSASVSHHSRIAFHSNVEIIPGQGRFPARKSTPHPCNVRFSPFWCFSNSPVFGGQQGVFVGLLAEVDRRRCPSPLFPFAIGPPRSAYFSIIPPPLRQPDIPPARLPFFPRWSSFATNHLALIQKKPTKNPFLTGNLLQFPAISDDPHGPP